MTITIPRTLKSFKKGVFPDALKIARIKPKHKAEPRQDGNNYRPISVLNAYPRIIEKILLIGLHEYLSLFNFSDDSDYIPVLSTRF